jgi:hypothetical protein
MQKNIRRFFAASSGLLLTAGVLTGGATAAGAAETGSRGSARVLACYDSASYYLKPAGGTYYPPGGEPNLRTTSACADINIKPNTNRYVRLCLMRSGTPQCQTDFTYAAAGSWTVVEEIVPNGTEFWFDFRSAAQSSGYWAA